jgi:hypothetical protein
MWFNNLTINKVPHKPIKAIICHLSPDMTAEDISSSLENLSFNVVNVRQMTDNRTAPDGTHMELFRLS